MGGVEKQQASTSRVQNPWFPQVSQARARVSSPETVGLMTGFGGSSADVKRNMVNSELVAAVTKPAVTKPPVTKPGISKPQGGRPPIGATAMTARARQSRYRAAAKARSADGKLDALELASAQ
jgi:hypothetical protein